MPDVAVDVHGEVSGAAADIADADTHLAFGLVQHRFSGRQRIEDEGENLHAATFHAIAQVLHRGSGSSDDVRFDFQAVPGEADGRVNAVLTVHGEAALDDVDDFAVVRHGDRLRGVQRARQTSSSSMTPPLMPTTPRELMAETCEPARLTRAELISSPEVRSAFSMERADRLGWQRQYPPHCLS